MWSNYLSICELLFVCETLGILAI